MSLLLTVCRQMGQKASSTLRQVVASQLRVHGIDLSELLEQYPKRSFDSIRTEIVTRTGIGLSARTVRRWQAEELEQAS